MVERELGGRENFLEKSAASENRRIRDFMVLGLGGPLDLIELAKSRVDPMLALASRGCPALGLVGDRLMFEAWRGLYLDWSDDLILDIEGRSA